VKPLLIALLGVLLLPLFVASWRTSLLGLAGQGLALFWIAFRSNPHVAGLEWWLTCLDLAVLRGALAPYLFYRFLESRHTPARNDVIPPNLLGWTVALAVVLVAFTFAEKIVRVPGDEQTLIAVAGAGLLLGFLVLATQSSPFSQVVGALRVENAIALAELARPEHWPLAVHAALVTSYLASVLFFRGYLARLASDVRLSQPAEPDVDSL